MTTPIKEEVAKVTDQLINACETGMDLCVELEKRNQRIAALEKCLRWIHAEMENPAMGILIAPSEAVNIKTQIESVLKGEK